MYSSPAFRSEHTFFSATSTAANITELTFRADWGQMDTHRIQEIHRSLSVRLGSLGSMACTGHFAAHNPQLVHSLVGLGTMIGRLMHRLLKGRRYVVTQNLKHAFPQMSEAERTDLERRIFENAGIAVFETGMAWFWSDARVKRLLIIDEQELAAAKALGEANTRTIAFTCHMVTLELGARLYALAIKPGIGVYRSSDHPVWEYIQVNGRLRSNLALIDRKDVRSMVKAVMKGYPIWYAPDQDYGITSSVFVPFFGVKDTCTVTGLHDLARIKDVKVQPFWLIREKSGYRMRVLAPLENFPTDDAVADTALGNRYVEDMIKSAPEQYLWMHRRFKTVPEGEPSRYPEVS